MRFKVIVWPFKMAWNVIKSLFGGGGEGPFGGFLGKVFKIFRAVFKIITLPYQLAWAVIKTIFGGGEGEGFFTRLINNIAGIFAPVINLLSGPFKFAWKIIKTVFGPVVGFFKSIGENIVGDFISVGVAIKGFFTGIWDSIKGAVFGFVNFFIDKINWMIGVANKIPGVNIPLIPKLEITKPPEMKPAELGVELKEFTKSENLVSASPWTVKTADADLKVGIEEAEGPKMPLMKAIIEPIFEAIPIITVFAKAILLTPLETLFGESPEVALAGGFGAPGPVGGGAGIAPSPYGGESYITNAPATHTTTSSSRTVVDRRVGPVHFHIQSNDPKGVVREIDGYFERLASQGDAIEDVEIG